MKKGLVQKYHMKTMWNILPQNDTKSHVSYTTQTLIHYLRNKLIKNNTKNNIE